MNLLEISNRDKRLIKAEKGCMTYNIDKYNEHYNNKKITEYIGILNSIEPLKENEVLYCIDADFGAFKIHRIYNINEVTDYNLYKDMLYSNLVEEDLLIKNKKMGVTIEYKNKSQLMDLKRLMKALSKEDLTVFVGLDEDGLTLDCLLSGFLEIENNFKMYIDFFTNSYTEEELKYIRDNFYDKLLLNKECLKYLIKETKFDSIINDLRKENFNTVETLFLEGVIDVNILLGDVNKEYIKKFLVGYKELLKGEY